MNKAIFLDRDGVINIDRDYVHKIEEFEFKDGIFELLRFFQVEGFLLVVITNQSGIARGYYTLDEFEKVTKYMLDSFEKEGIKIQKVYFCPHGTDVSCECRKPSPGMILQAQKEFDIELSHSMLIGDKKTDIEAGRRAGVGINILVSGKKGEDLKSSSADYVVDELLEIKSIYERS